MFRMLMIQCGVMVSGLRCGRGKMWRVIKVYSSAVLLDGECSEAFDVQQGVAQGCSLSPILFSVFINGL